MSEGYKHTIAIDPDALVSELIESWINGNKNDVIYQLKTDHAGLTAMMLIQGSADKLLTRSDCNEIANRLIDDRHEQAMKVWANDNSLDSDIPSVKQLR